MEGRALTRSPHQSAWNFPGSHQFLATLRADLCSTEWPSQQRRTRSPMTLNMFRFKSRVPGFAPFINLRTKLTPEKNTLHPPPSRAASQTASSGRAGRSWAGARLCWTAPPGCARRRAGHSGRPGRPPRASCGASARQLSGCPLVSRCLAQETRGPQENGRLLHGLHLRAWLRPRNSPGGPRPGCGPQTPEGPDSAARKRQGE